MLDASNRIRLWIKALLFERRKYKFQSKNWSSLRDLEGCARVLSQMSFRTDQEPVLSDGPKGQRILVIAPHPDDEMIGAGGTLIKAIRRGAEVRVLYLTSGKGDTARILEEETLAVSRKVGYSVDFLRQPQKRIPLDGDFISEVARRIAGFDLDALLVPVLLDDHDDHRRASHVLLKVFEFGGIPQSVEVWGFQVYTALRGNVVVDICDVKEDKAKYIAMWSSQMLIRDWSHYSLGLNAYHCRFVRNTAGEAYGESFVVLPIHEYVGLCSSYFQGDGTDAYYTSWYRGRGGQT
jgi:LmbE family N-acetylglucosaminyl deacetylase